MRVHIGGDHAAYDLQSDLVSLLQEEGHDVIDHGPDDYDAEDDYPVSVLRAAEAVAGDPGSLGVVLGGSGNGEQIAANKVERHPRRAGLHAPSWPSWRASTTTPRSSRSARRMNTRRARPSEIVDVFLATRVQRRASGTRAGSAWWQRYEHDGDAAADPGRSSADPRSARSARCRRARRFRSRSRRAPRSLARHRWLDRDDSSRTWSRRRRRRRCRLPARSGAARVLGRLVVLGRPSPLGVLVAVSVPSRSPWRVAAGVPYAAYAPLVVVAGLFLPLRLRSSVCSASSPSRLVWVGARSSSRRKPGLGAGSSSSASSRR